MRQFFAAKADCPDAILFFRLGDFYEMFYDDAVRVAELLELTLTSRGKGPDGERIPMAGVPHHAAAGYIAKLLAAGERVAICEQMAEPSQVKGVVPRQIVRVVTPGLCHDPTSLDARTNNYLTAVARIAGEVAIASLDVSTGELEVTSVRTQAELLSELLRIEPREILLDESERESDWLAQACAELDKHLPNTVTRQRPFAANRQDWPPSASWLARASDPERLAAAAALGYATESARGEAVHIHSAKRGDRQQSLVLDDAAVRNLELVRTLRGERVGSLLDHLDKTMTAVGARALRRRLLAPSQNLQEVREWANFVSALKDEGATRKAIRDSLREVRDLERLAVRAELAMASPRDLAALRASLKAIRDVSAVPLGRVSTHFEGVDLCLDLLRNLEQQLADEPPVTTASGGAIRDNVSATLDELRELAAHGKDVVAKMEARERQQTGIGSLKIKYTRVFGYYLEVTKSNLAAVPAHYQRKQTIANGERYITEELAELQDRILSAQDRALKLEAELFAELRATVGSAATRLHALARCVAELDIHAALAEVAVQHDYVKPTLCDTSSIDLKQSRHPIVEKLLPTGSFIANDIALDVNAARFAMITGPNMAGKSTVMRQVALSVIMAQMGAFVPAREATIGIVDRIHTRVGASDSIAHGQSTFMVEMTETATILQNATKRSLVIVDEVGRGTSTYDGLAIAWAVAEYLHNEVGCMTLFATHYHELCKLANPVAGTLLNMHVAARHEAGRMLFVHELRPGSTSRSYGVEVARLAGLPKGVVDRAQSLLGSFEPVKQPERVPPQPSQAELFAAEPETYDEELRALDKARTVLSKIPLDETSPIDAWHALREIQSILTED